MSDLSSAAILSDANNNQVGLIFDGTNWRLAVDTRPTSGVSPQQPAWGNAPASGVIQTPLTKGSSAAINVNGSSTAQQFTFTPGAANATIYAVRLIFTFTAFTYNGSNFGNAALTNGIAVGATSGGTASTITTIKTNEDLLTANGNGLLNSGQSGFLAAGIVLMNQPLVGGSSDNVFITVQDNLAQTNILYARAVAFGIRT